MVALVVVVVVLAILMQQLQTVVLAGSAAVVVVWQPIIPTVVLVEMEAHWVVVVVLAPMQTILLQFVRVGVVGMPVVVVGLLVIMEHQMPVLAALELLFFTGRRVFK
jgi:hypothetical protein